MSPAPKPGVIINQHNQPEYLARGLKAVACQIIRPEKVLLADDGPTAETREVFVAWSAKQSFRCEHLWHPPVSRSGLPASDDLCEQAKRLPAVRCDRGLDQYMSETR